MNKLETAKRLARAHFQVEPPLKFVFVRRPLDDRDPKDTIRLLEVVEGTLERGFEPIAFAPGPAHGIEYPSLVIEISSAEYQSVQSDGCVSFGNRLWDIGEELSRVERASAHASD